MQESRTIEDAPAGRRSPSMCLTPATSGGQGETVVEENHVRMSLTTLRKIVDVNLPGGDPPEPAVVELLTAHMELVGLVHLFPGRTAGAHHGIPRVNERLSSPVGALLPREKQIGPYVVILLTGIALVGSNVTATLG